jgi:hypothetical protein
MAIVAVLVRTDRRYAVYIFTVQAPTLMASQSVGKFPSALLLERHLTISNVSVVAIPWSSAVLPVGAQTDRPLLRFVRRHLISVRVHGTPFLCVQCDGVGSYYTAPVVDRLSVACATQSLLVLLTERNSLGIASYHQLVHSLSAVYHHTVTMQHAVFLPRHNLIVAADVEGTVVVLDPHQQRAQRLAVCVGSYKFAPGTVISDVQPLVTSTDEDVVLVAVCLPRNSPEDGKRLAYVERRVLVLAVNPVQKNGLQLQPATTHHPIDWYVCNSHLREVLRPQTVCAA